MPKRGRCGMVGQRQRISCGIASEAVVNCCDNSGAKSLNVIGVANYKNCLNRYPKAAVGDVIIITVGRDGKPDLRRKVTTAVLVRQRKCYRRQDATWIYFEDNAAVIINGKGETKGSSINGPVSKEAAEKFAKISTQAPCVY